MTESRSKKRVEFRFTDDGFIDWKRNEAQSLDANEATAVAMIDIANGIQKLTDFLGYNHFISSMLQDPLMQDLEPSDVHNMVRRMAFHLASNRRKDGQLDLTGIYASALGVDRADAEAVLRVMGLKAGRTHEER